MGRAYAHFKFTSSQKFNDSANTLKSLRFQHFRVVPWRAKKVVKMVENVQRENAVAPMDSKVIYVKNNSIEQKQKFKKHWKYKVFAMW